MSVSTSASTTKTEKIRKRGKELKDEAEYQGVCLVHSLAKCGESKREWYDKWKEVEEGYDKYLTLAHQSALDKMGLPRRRAYRRDFKVGLGFTTDWWKSEYLREMAVHGMPEIIAKCLDSSHKLTFYITGRGFQDSYDVQNVKRYLLSDAEFKVHVEDGRAVSIQDPLGDFLSKLDIRLVPNSARMGDLLDEHLKNPNEYVILTGGKGSNTFRYKPRVIDITQ